jgi:hypothetical protein
MWIYTKPNAIRSKLFAAFTLYGLKPVLGADVCMLQSIEYVIVLASCTREPMRSTAATWVREQISQQQNIHKGKARTRCNFRN